MSERVLVVEDEETLRQNIARFLQKQGHEVTALENGSDAIRYLDAHEVDIVLTDLRLPGSDGLAVLEHVKATRPDTAVLLMTAYASLASAVEALRRGAHDYLLKPVSLAALAAKVDHIASYRQLGRENARLRRMLRGDTDSASLLQLESRPMQELADVVRKIAPSSSNVLIQGESGTGKEIVARAIHEQSPRADAPFVPVNVSAIPENLVESYLFGHERGAFTGADRRRDGLFRTATGGTLFLDEIGELQPSLQAKLLRAVETKEILPVGADHGIKVDTRLVSATHRDLAALAREGRFRDDLLYRLSVVKVKVPPLRERVEDIPVLVGRFLAKQSLEQKKRVASVDPTAMKALMRYGWPGNVRELSNVIERAVLLADGETVSMADLPLEIRGESFPEDDCNLENALAAFERKHIASVLATCEGNRESAAKALGISPATLYRRLEKLDLKGYRGGPIAGA